MKKKIAFFLAVIMVVSSISGITLGASSMNRITRMITDTESNTLWFEEGMGVGTGEFTRRHYLEPIQYWREGTSLHIELNHNVSAGTQFTVDLEGAAWYFRQEGIFWSYDVPKDPIWGYSPMVITCMVGAMEFAVTIPAGNFHPGNFFVSGIDEIFPSVMTFGAEVVVTNHTEFTANLSPRYKTVPPVPSEPPEYMASLLPLEDIGIAATAWINNNFYNWRNEPIWNWTAINTDTDDLVLTATVPLDARDALLSVDALELVWIPRTGVIYHPGVTVPWLPFGEIRERADTWTPENLEYVMPASTFDFVPRVFCVDTRQIVGGRFLEFDETRTVTTFYNFEDGVAYKLEIVGGTWQTRATVIILEDVTPTVSDDSTIKIPLVLRTTRGDDIRVRVSAGFHQISNTIHIIGQNFDYIVKARFEGVTIQSHQIDIARLILAEQRAGAMPDIMSWGFEIWAPDGYLWDSSDIPNVFPLPPLAWADGTTDIKCFNETGMTGGHRLINGELDKSSLLIYMNEGVIRSSTTGHGGELRFTNLRLVPINPNNVQDGRRLYATVQNFAGSVVSEGDMFIGVERVHQNNNNQNNNNNNNNNNQNNNQGGGSTPDNDNNDQNQGTNNQAAGDGRGNWGGSNQGSGSQSAVNRPSNVTQPQPLSAVTEATQSQTNVGTKDIITISIPSDADYVSVSRNELQNNYTVTVELDDIGRELNTRRLTAINESGARIGGSFNRVTGLFEFETTAMGTFTIAYVYNLNRIMLHIGSYDIINTAQGTSFVMDVTPLIQDGRALIPVRFVAYALDADVEWDSETSEITLSIDDKTLTFAIGEMVQGMDVPAQIIDDRTMVPIRFISEFFGASVSWDENTRRIEIVK